MNVYIEYLFMYPYSIKETGDCWWAFDAWSSIRQENFYSMSLVFVSTHYVPKVIQTDIFWRDN